MQQEVMDVPIQMKCCRWNLATPTVVMVTAGWLSPGNCAPLCHHLKGSIQLLSQHLILVNHHILIVCSACLTLVGDIHKKSLHKKTLSSKDSRMYFIFADH